MRIKINKLSEYIGKSVVIKGFVETIRNQGSIAFLNIRDNSGKVQVVVDKDAILIIEKITLESVVSLTGSVIKTPSTATGIEVHFESIEVLSLASNLLPIPIHAKSGNEADQSIRLDWRWLDLRNQQRATVFSIWTTMEQAFRQFCIDNEFTQIHSPKTVITSTESGSELFEIKYFGQKAYLAQSPQLYKQMAMAAGLERVFEIGPVFRANPSFTSRHDTEFTMYDIEMSYIESHHELMDFEEQLMRAVFDTVEAKHGEAIEQLYRTSIHLPDSPFPRISFKETKVLLAQLGIESKDAYDLAPEEERALCKYYFEKEAAEFVFVYDWYAKSRAFYSMKHEESPELSKTFDLLYRGLEVTSGAQREHRYDVLREQILAQGLSAEKFESYLNFFKYGCPPHGGFAPGPSRILMKMLGLDNVREVTYLYRGVNRITP